MGVGKLEFRGKVATVHNTNVNHIAIDPKKRIVFHPEDQYLCSYLYSKEGSTIVQSENWFFRHPPDDPWYPNEDMQGLVSSGVAVDWNHNLVFAGGDERFGLGSFKYDSNGKVSLVDTKKDAEWTNDWTTRMMDLNRGLRLIASVGDGAAVGVNETVQLYHYSEHGVLKYLNQRSVPASLGSTGSVWFDESNNMVFVGSYWNELFVYKVLWDSENLKWYLSTALCNIDDASKHFSGIWGDPSEQVVWVGDTDNYCIHKYAYELNGNLVYLGKAYDWSFGGGALNPNAGSTKYRILVLDKYDYLDTTRYIEKKIPLEVLDRYEDPIATVRDQVIDDQNDLVIVQQQDGQTHSLMTYSFIAPIIEKNSGIPLVEGYLSMYPKFQRAGSNIQSTPAAPGLTVPELLTALKTAVVQGPENCPIGNTYLSMPVFDASHFDSITAGGFDISDTEIVSVDNYAVIREKFVPSVGNKMVWTIRAGDSGVMGESVWSVNILRPTDNSLLDFAGVERDWVASYKRQRPKTNSTAGSWSIAAYDLECEFIITIWCDVDGVVDFSVRMINESIGVDTTASGSLVSLWDYVGIEVNNKQPWRLVKYYEIADGLPNACIGPVLPGDAEAESCLNALFPDMG